MLLAYLESLNPRAWQPGFPWNLRQFLDLLAILVISEGTQESCWMRETDGVIWHAWTGPLNQGAPHNTTGHGFLSHFGLKQRKAWGRQGEIYSQWPMISFFFANHSGFWIHFQSRRKWCFKGLQPPVALAGVNYTALSPCVFSLAEKSKEDLILFLWGIIIAIIMVLLI